MERKKCWKCPDCCSEQKKGGDNSLTPVRAGSESGNTQKRLDTTASDTSQLVEQLRLLTSEFSSVKTKLEELTESLSFTNEKMKDMMNQLADTDKRLKYLEKRDSEVESLQATVYKLQSDLKAQEQASLRNEVEIIGVPETATENLHHIVLVAAKKVGVDLDDGELDWVTRVGPRRPPVKTSLPEDGAIMPRPIVVKLLRRFKRDQFVKAAKSRQNINSSDLGVAGKSRKVFFNERLTKENRVLFRESRLRAKLHEYAFCWCNQGVIYIRQREGKAATPILSHNDLDRLLPPMPSNTL